jgi:hypothetical protein
MWWRINNLNFWRNTSTQDLISQSDNTQVLDSEVLGLISDSIEDGSLLGRDTVLAHLELHIRCIKFIFHPDNTDISKTIDLILVNNKMLFEARPRHASFLFELNLEQLKVIDNLCHNPIFNELICTPKQKSSKDTSCFKFLYERKPLKYPKLDSNVLLKTSALNIILNPHVINQISNLFASITYEFKDVKFYAYTGPMTAADATKDVKNNMKLINRIKNFNKYLTKMFIDIEINAPNLIFPCVVLDSELNVDENQSKIPAVIMDFGKLTFFNKFQQFSYVVKDNNFELLNNLSSLLNMNDDSRDWVDHGDVNLSQVGLHIKIE